MARCGWSTTRRYPRAESKATRSCLPFFLWASELRWRRFRPGWRASARFSTCSWTLCGDARASDLRPAKPKSGTRLGMNHLACLNWPPVLIPFLLVRGPCPFPERPSCARPWVGPFRCGAAPRLGGQSRCPAHAASGFGRCSGFVAFVVVLLLAPVQPSASCAATRLHG